MNAHERILLLGGPSDGLGALVEGPDPVLELVPGLEPLLAHLSADDPSPSLVVVDPGWPQPLTAVRDIRRVDATVGIAVAASAATTDTMRSKLGFLPDAEEVRVVAVDGGPTELRRRLVELAATSVQRRRVRGALDAINRDLAGLRSAGTAGGRSAAVSEHYLAALIRHAADTIVSCDPQGRVVTINEAGQSTLGLDPLEAEGRPLPDLLGPEDPGEMAAMLSAAAAGRTEVDHELAVRLPGGRHLVLSATAAPVFDDRDRVAGLVLIARDVTLERKSERRLRALQKAESLATLASGVAHDFNNLLVQAQGWADLARSDPGDRDLVTTALDNILEATRGASELARAMLVYGGRGRFESQELDLASLFGDLRPLLTATVPSRVRIEIDVTDAPHVLADPTQLRQVILNLVTNAAEAMGDDDGTVWIATRTETVAGTDQGRGGAVTASPLTAGTYAVIDVRDDGPGIDPAVHHRLFDPFFTTKFTGRGLGLAASQGIARAHDGDISVDSRPGEGACFRVHLPTAP